MVIFSVSKDRSEHYSQISSIPLSRNNGGYDYINKVLPSIKCVSTLCHVQSEFMLEWQHGLFHSLSTSLTRILDLIKTNFAKGWVQYLAREKEN